MKQAILDTDTISYYFRNHSHVVQKVDYYLKEYGFINLSVVTYYEVLNGLMYKDAKRQLDRFEEFVSFNQVLPLNQKIAQRAAQTFADLRKTGITIGHNDIMIAATAIENNMRLISNNSNHFGKVKDLDLDNWTY